MTFKRLDPQAILPIRATIHSAGLDIFALEEDIIYPACTKLIRTGLTFEIDQNDSPEETYMGLYIRSSLAYKYQLMLANGVGIIDMDYAGNEIGVLLHNANPDRPYHVKKGEKIAQIIVHQHYSNLAGNVTLRYTDREGGFGSTDGK